MPCRIRPRMRLSLKVRHFFFKLTFLLCPASPTLLLGYIAHILLNVSLVHITLSIPTSKELTFERQLVVERNLAGAQEKRQGTFTLIFILTPASKEIITL